MHPTGLRTSFDPQVVDHLPDRLIVFDGDCVFCSHWVRFILPRDIGELFRFTAIQSPLGRMIAARLGINALDPSTNVVIVGQVAYFKSDSALAALDRLPGWRWTRAFHVVPKALRDWAYDGIARNRYKLFGRKEQCLVPQARHAGRFLEDLDRATPARDIAAPPPDSLFASAPGSAAFDKMPGPIRHLHGLFDTAAFNGVAQVDGAANILGAAIARLFRFPRPASDVEVRVTIEPGYGRETWRRRFGRSRFSSVLSLDPQTRELTERFGLIRCALDVRCHEAGLDMRIASARLGALPLPRWWVPWTRAHERLDAQGRFTFDVEIGLPGVGRLVRYRGWLTD